MPDSRRRGRRLQGPLQRRRTAARAVGLRRRRAVRSDREEAVLPRLSRRARLQLRHARLRSPLRLLPELGDVAGAARSGGRRAAAATRTPRATGPRRRAAQGAQCWSAPTTSRSSPREWAVAIFKEAKARRAGHRLRVERQRHAARCSIYLRPWIDLYKVDLKSFDDRHYRELGGRSTPILDTIRRLHAMGIWVEIVTLLIPGFNDSRRRADAADRVRRRRLAGHPVARHRVPRRLQDDRPGEHDAGDADDAPRTSGARPGCATSTPAICRARSAISRTRAAPACGDTLDRAIRLSASATTGSPPDGRCPSLRHGGARPLEQRFEGSSVAPFVPGAARGSSCAALILNPEIG